MKMAIYMKRILAFCFYVLSGGIFFAILLLSMRSYFLNQLHWLFILMVTCCLTLVIGSYFLCSSLKRMEDKIHCTKTILCFVWGLYITFIFFIGILIYYKADFSGDRRLNELSVSSINVIPLASVYQYIIGVLNHTLNISYLLRVTLGNLLLFAPLGILLPCTYKTPVKTGPFIIIFLVIRIAFEIIQLILQIGMFNVDDVLLSLIGAVIVYKIHYINFVQSCIKRLFF